MFFGATPFHNQEVKDACSKYYKLQASVSELDKAVWESGYKGAYGMYARYARLKEAVEFELIKHRFSFPDLFCHWEGLRKSRLLQADTVDDPTSLGVCCL